MSATLMPAPRQRFVDNAGLPLANGMVFTFAAGTSDKIAAFQDPDGLIPHENPIRLDIRGEALIYWLGNYKVDVRNAIGIPLAGYPVDNFNAIDASSAASGSVAAAIAMLASASGSSNIGFIQAGVGALKRTSQDKMRDSVSVKDFGAVGDGANDDTASIQKAVNSGAGLVLIPRGTYKITADIKMPLRVSLRGDGAMQSILQPYNCDALTFSDTGFEQDNASFSGFSIFGQAGANYTAINCPTGSGVKYGLHFEFLTISNMNQGIIFSNNLNCSISRCHFEFVTNPITLGDVSTFTRVFLNTMISAGGTSNGGSAPSCGINVIGGSNSEAIKILHNFIYGFATGIQVGTVTDLLIDGNGIDACSLYGINFTAVNYAFNIVNNFIELIGASSIACINGQPLGAGEYMSQINIENNSFTSLAPVSVGSTGILMNTAVDTFQWHLRIVGNIFLNMTKNDIRINLPGETVIENNRCMSVIATSLWIGTVQKAPVHIGKNWLKGGTYFDGANDVILGKVILDHNTESNTFVPYSGNWLPTFTASTGTFGSITYGQQEATFFRIGNVVHFSIVMYTTAVAIGSASGTLQISGFPFLPRKTTACAVSDSRTWATGKNPLSAAVSIAGNLVMYSRATVAGDTVALTPADLSAVAGPANVITVSGSYICQ